MAKTKNIVDYQEILLMAHPIGSYYISEDGTSPNILFGGAWEKLKE